ncbi:MAG: TIGR02611 family protein [Microlunatus sp.]|nr:TIGR02611 family protein [Microlunatus sp.]
MSKEQVEDVESAATRERFAWRARIRANPTTYLIYRVAVALVGLVVVVVGLVLLPLPGPGWLIIFLGIGIWGTEFTWARRLLHFTRAKVRRWTDWLARQGHFVHVLVGLGTLLVVAACLWLLLLVNGVPGFLSDQVKDLLGHLPGL